MATLYIPNSVNLRNFDALFRDNSFDFSDGHAEIRFHPTMVALHPVGLAFYAALGDRLQAAGVRTTAEINERIHTIPFLQRMGLFGALGSGGPGRSARSWSRVETPDSS